MIEFEQKASPRSVAAPTVLPANDRRRLLRLTLAQENAVEEIARGEQTKSFATGLALLPVVALAAAGSAFDNELALLLSIAASLALHLHQTKTMEREHATMRELVAKYERLLAARRREPRL